MNMYILWILYALFLGTFARTLTRQEKIKNGGFTLGKDDEGYFLSISKIRFSVTTLVGSIAFFLIIGFINDITYAVWIGSILGFLGVLLLVLLASIFLEATYFRLYADALETSYKGNRRVSRNNSLPINPANPGIFVAVPILFFILIIVSIITGSIIPFILAFLIIPLLIIFNFMFISFSDEVSSLSDASSMISAVLGLGRDSIPVSKVIKVFLAVFIFFLLILANITPLTGNLDFNPTFKALNDTEDNTEDSNVFLTDYTDVRVISWDLATQYLQRAYSDAASTLSTDQDVLSLNTDPDHVNGKFVWVNAPQYETLKWLGGKKIPFFVYVVNDPRNMSKDGFDAVRHSNESFEVQREKITWGNRIDQVLHDRYAGKYVTIQIRINLDEEHHPFWVVYLGKRHILYDVVDLEKILIIDAVDIDRSWEYDVDDKDIPDWLEVVYPDNYLMDWAKLWGSWRNGITYKWFNKRHLSYPDDTPRFLILNGTAFWYLPMRQLDSKVLAGYILMNTRTGETTYHNREARSLADRFTATLQVERYLSSGIQGFRQLTIQEGYLYPIKMDNGRVREAYIFPLYSGFTIQQYAIVDAEFYTQNPFFGTDIQSLLTEYSSHIFEADENITHVWESFAFESAYADEEEGAFTANGTTYIVNRADLSAGEISDADNEWREFRLSVSDFERGENVTIDGTVLTGKLLDVDYPEASLVER